MHIELINGKFYANECKCFFGKCKCWWLVGCHSFVFFFLLPCLGETFMTVSHALGRRAAEESRELGTWEEHRNSCILWWLWVWAPLPQTCSLSCHLSLRASWLLKGQNLLSLFYRRRIWSWPWVGGMPQVIDLVRAQPGKETRLLWSMLVEEAERKEGFEDFCVS